MQIVKEHQSNPDAVADHAHINIEEDTDENNHNMRAEVRKGSVDSSPIRGVQIYGHNRRRLLLAVESARSQVLVLMPVGVIPSLWICETQYKRWRCAQHRNRKFGYSGVFSSQ